jgi:SAM-dependent methyltransferase
MIEMTDSEIDVEQLMAEIRAAVERREAEGQRSLIGASVELYEMLSAAAELQNQPDELPPISLQPEFVPRDDDHYHVNDLLAYHDHTFIWNAYRAILKREPDEEGLRQYLKNLRSGRFNKIDVLASLRFSPEGKSRNVRVEGLTRPALIRRLYRVPVLGYLLEMLVGMARLPVMIRSQREHEGHALAQQERLASHVNQLSRTSFQVAESFSRELAQVAEEQRKFAELQHQQIVGLFREQREIIGRLKQMKDELDARLAQLDESQKSETVHQSTSAPASTDERRSRLDELLASFADQLRGKTEEVKAGLKFYLPIIKSAGLSCEILDLGCGRGEWLELLKGEGLAARGVELNGVLVERARGLGLEVAEMDALHYLRELPDRSLNVVTGFHLIEHLSFESLIELLDEIARTLRPNGLVIFETPNPKNLVVGACNFYADPTHHRPLFPDTMQFIMSKCGFADVRLAYLNPVNESPFTDESAGAQALNSWLYSARDFALIGRRS